MTNVDELLARLQSRALKVFCAIDGTRKAFPVDINDNDTGSDLQERIKLKQPIRLSMLEASGLNLYKAPKGGGITEPGVTIGAKDEIDATSSLRGMFAETNTVQVIVRPPSFVRGPLNVVQYNSRSEDLVWREDTFKSFPAHNVNDLKTLRQSPDLCYFDKTAFIMALESLSGPARGLSIDEHVKKECLSPGRYFVLRFDFSAVNRSQDLKKAEHNLNLMLNESIKRFYKTYEPYHRMSADYLIDNFIKDDAAETDADSLLKAFWASVKSGLGKLKIAKCYITCVSLQSLVDNTSGFNIARYVSWEPELAGFCGLTEANVTAALALKNVCESTAEAEKHLKIMRNHYNGFSFVPGGQWPLTYNTNTCLEYLERLAVRKPMENLLSVTNSEASEVSLRLLAASPVATRLLEDGLFSGSEQGKNVEDRAGEIVKNKEAWLSYMVHLGGLTFCVGKKALRIPNLVAAERFGSAILHRHEATLQNVNGV
ncbi:hypothetical protein EC957_008362 [Mortierella hygrophila]|uniref:Crinkler effector protein N-terminal domain-containing protein n=1 Tax=Mortierella hygrophila TaxID=979708 RepID=A0A9P6FCD6_9FUNG|nr:hypothetical protein EC957_008362 [Mortierella hygrophila]